MALLSADLCVSYGRLIEIDTSIYSAHTPLKIVVRTVGAKVLPQCTFSGERPSWKVSRDIERSHDDAIHVCGSEQR